MKTRMEPYFSMVSCHKFTFYSKFHFIDTYWLWKMSIDDNFTEGVQIFGWHYSDNTTVLPNTKKLFTYGKIFL